MTAPRKLVLATHNKGKLAEIADMLNAYNVEVTSAGELNLPEPDETENTFVGNARIKAHAAVKATGLPVLADDSGLCVNALNGEPGVYTANWAGPDRDYPMAMRKVNDLLGDNPDRSAYFTTVLVYVTPDGQEQIFEGKCHGNLVWPPRGSGGMGYDPIFVAEGETRTFAEMTIEEKKQFSHRAQAFKNFVQFVF